jgi:GTP cyclohydrolase I
MNLKNVGIKDIRFPVKIREKGGTRQDTVALVTLQVNTPKRFCENCVATLLGLLGKYGNDISPTTFPALLRELKTELMASSARLTMTFPYFIEKKAPVTKTAGLMEYTCSFTGTSENKDDLIMTMWVPTTTLCPCSKEISDYGAHNQRAEIRLDVKFSEFIWLEDLITMVETSASCELFSLLKRPDEKYVTEKAYENPMFVEDAVRKVAGSANDHPHITWFSVGVESFESIHKHSAYAIVTSDTMGN